MFSKATANFVRQVDPDGSFIHVSRVNDSLKLLPLALVVKRNRFWFWQSPKYLPTDFTLADLLQGTEPLQHSVSRSEFVSFQGTFRDKCMGKLDTEAPSISVSLEGRGISKLQSSFNKLDKEKLDVKELLRGSTNRLVDMQHVLVRQLKKKSEVLVVVKEIVLTTSPCSLTHTRKDQCALKGALSLLSQLGGSVQVSVKESNSVEVDSDVSLEIPSGTVIAFSVMELEIEKDGQFVIGVQPNTIGGICSDMWRSHDSLHTVDGRSSQKGAPVLLGALLDESTDLELGPLALLHQESRRSIFKDLREVVRDRTALSSLECLLQDLSRGEKLKVAAHGGELSDSQWELVWAVLRGLGEEELTGSSSSGESAVLSAAHLLVSALEELPDETLILLSCCSPDLLDAFDSLLRSLKESAEPLLSLQRLPAPLRDEQTLQQGAQLLSCTNTALRWDGEWLWLQGGSDDDEGGAGLPTVVLYAAVCGLSLLAK